MADRSTLRVSDLERFIKWAEGKGYMSADPVGEYEIARLIPRERPPLLYYRRAKGDRVTCHPGEATRLAHRWAKERKR